MTNEKLAAKEELIIVSHVTKKDVQSITLGECYFSPEQKKEIDRLVALRLAGVPLEQVLGKVDFFDLDIRITKDVLIPRVETEIFVEKILLSLTKDSLEGKVAVDLCAGSGCIGLAVKKNCPMLTVILSDISKSAIEVSKENARINALHVDCVVGNLFEGVKEKKIDYLFCNPPYIPEREYFSLDKGVKDHEPKLALLGGEDGLMFYRMIEKEAKKRLNPGAKLFFEIGYNQGASVIKIFSDPVWQEQNVSLDYAGHDRFFFLEFHP